MQDKKIKNILMLGDVYGKSGCSAVLNQLQSLKEKYGADFVIINGENAEKGFGLDPETASSFFQHGIDVITNGNHIWEHEEILDFLDSDDRILRPMNYPNPAPGRGYTIKNGIGVINLQGRVSMQSLEDPFIIVDKAIDILSQQTKLIFIDFHAEEPSEKEALAFYVKGRVTGIVGTHTHVQTADEKIINPGTAYISDLGLCGPWPSVIGGCIESSIQRNKTQMPIKAVPSTNPGRLQGVCIKCDIETGKAISIERISSR